MGLLIIADRDVFTRRKAVGAESISRFIVISPGAIVVKDPTRVLAAPRFVYEKAELVVFAFPEPPHATIFTRVLPELRTMWPFASRGATNSYPWCAEPVGKSFERAR